MTIERVSQVYSPDYQEDVPTRLLYQVSEEQIPSGLCQVWRLCRIEYLLEPSNSHASGLPSSSLPEKSPPKKLVDGDRVVGVISLGHLAERLDGSSALGQISAAPPDT